MIPIWSIWSSYWKDTIFQMMLQTIGHMWVIKTVYSVLVGKCFNNVCG